MDLLICGFIASFVYVCFLDAFLAIFYDSVILYSM